MSGGGFTVWFTGLPCSGKTTLATALQKELNGRRMDAQLLDGDTVRKSVSSDLGYSRSDRETHIRRVVSLASSLTEQTPVIVSLISPYRSMRAYARERLTPFVEIYLCCSLAVCEARDVKGLYRLAREGKITGFTGISDGYEEPLSPDLALDTGRLDVRTCVAMIIQYLEGQKLI